MAQSKPKPKGRRRWKRAVLIAALLLCLPIAALALFPGRTLNPLVRWAGPRLAARAGIELEIGDLTGAPWTLWRFEDLALRAKAWNLEGVRSAELSLADGFWHKFGPQAIEAVRVQGGTFEWQGGEGSTSSDADSGGGEGLKLPDLPQVQVEDFAVHLSSPTLGEVRIPQLRVQVKGPTDAGQALHVQTGAVTWKQPQGEEYAAELVVSGRWRHQDLEGLQANLRVNDYGRLQVEGGCERPLRSDRKAQVRVLLKEGAWRELKGLEGFIDAGWQDGSLEVQQLLASGEHGWSVKGEGLHWSSGESTPGASLAGQITVVAPDVSAAFGSLLPPNTPPIGGLDLKIQAEDGAIAVQSLRVSAQPLPDFDTVTLTGSGRLEPGSDGLPLQAKLQVDLPAGTWHLPDRAEFEWPSLAAELDLAGPLWQPSGAVRFADAKVRVTPAEHAPYDSSIDLNLQLQDGVITLQDASFAFTEGDSNLGRLTASGDLASLEQWRTDARQAPIDLSAELDFPDLAVLVDWLPGLRRLSGTATGAGHIDGTLAAPRWRGETEVNATALRLTQGEFWRDLKLTAQADESGNGRAHLTSLYGGAEVTADLQVDWSQGAPRYSGTLKSEGFPVLQEPEARVRADLDWSVSGEGSATKVRGSTALVYGRLQHEFDLSGKLLDLMEGRRGTKEKGPVAATSQANPLDISIDVPTGLDLDVELTTRHPLAVVSDLAKTELSVQGRIVARSGRLYPEGNVTMGGGQVSLPGSTLRWQHGVILLPKGGGVPTIEAQGETRLVGTDVRVRVHGPLDNPVLELTSTPQRPRYDLLVLLLTGELPSDRDLSRTTESLSVYLAKDLLRRWFSDDDPDGGESLLDRLEIYSGREVSESGLGTLEAMFRLRGEGDGRGKALWVTAERDRYDDVNFGLRFVLRPR
ncbi:MAG: translocation/assembly module TamB domain-containing protein [Planctomycetota bacterium]